MTTASYFRDQAGTLLRLAGHCRHDETAERLRAMAADLTRRADELEVIQADVRADWPRHQ